MSDNSVHESTATDIGERPDTGSEKTHDPDRFRIFASDYEHVRMALACRVEDLGMIEDMARWMTGLFNEIKEDSKRAKTFAEIGSYLACEVSLMAENSRDCGRDTLERTPEDKPHRMQWRGCCCPDCRSEGRGDA